MATAPATHGPVLGKSASIRAAAVQAEHAARLAAAQLESEAAGRQVKVAIEVETKILELHPGDPFHPDPEHAHPDYAHLSYAQVKMRDGALPLQVKEGARRKSMEMGLPVAGQHLG